MYVYVYVYIGIYIYIHVYTCIYTYACIHIYIYIYIYLNRVSPQIRLRKDIFNTTKSDPGSMKITKTEGLL